MLRSVVKGIHWRHGPTPIEHIGALLDAGADANAKDHNGETALHRAVVEFMFDRSGEQKAEVVVEVIEIFVGCGADRAASDGFGRTALQRAEGAVAEPTRRVEQTILTALR